MIAFSTITSNTTGTLILDELSDSEFGNKSVNISRILALDGSVAWQNNGASYDMRDFILKVRVTETIRDKIYDFYEYTLLRLSCIEGCFVGAISSILLDGDKITISFKVKEDVTR